MLRLFAPLVLLCVCGCFRQPSYLVEAPPADPEPGWRVVSNEEGRVSIALPKGWQEINVRSGELVDFIKAHEQLTDLQEAEMRTQLKSMAENEGLRIYAIDLAGLEKRGAKLSSLMVMRYDVRRVGQLDEIADGMVLSLKNTLGQDAVIERRQVSLPVGPAVEVRHTSDVPIASGGRATFQHVIYVMVHGSELVSVTFSYPIELDDAEVPDTDAIVKTFRLKP